AYVRAASLERHVRRWGLLPFALWGGAIGIAIATAHVPELLRWWVVPMLVFLCGPYTFFALPEHYTAPHNASMLTTTASVRSNALYRWLTLDGNYHLAHHVFPNASWWRLGEVDGHLQDVSALRYPGYVSFYRNVWHQLSTSSGSAAPVQ
ncbi:MAG TPA: fatty acid desaturase, partial [Ilumatobacteraceae bacterium]|nr:fatty acid desaturase [Ilumatobacteraceae bacterium]